MIVTARLVVLGEPEKVVAQPVMAPIAVFEAAVESQESAGTLHQVKMPGAAELPVTAV